MMNDDHDDDDGLKTKGQKDMTRIENLLLSFYQPAAQPFYASLHIGRACELMCMRR
jgi:hypothetical protein